MHKYDCSATTKNLWGMLLGRLFVGTGMGLGPAVAALYVSEVHNILIVCTASHSLELKLRSYFQFALFSVNLYLYWAGITSLCKRYFWNFYSDFIMSRSSGIPIYGTSSQGNSGLVSNVPGNAWFKNTSKFSFHICANWAVHQFLYEHQQISQLFWLEDFLRWRACFWASVIPAALLALLMEFSAESPHWLFKVIIPYII